MPVAYSAAGPSVADAISSGRVAELGLLLVLLKGRLLLV